MHNYASKGERICLWKQLNVYQNYVYTLSVYGIWSFYSPLSSNLINAGKTLGRGLGDVWNFCHMTLLFPPNAQSPCAAPAFPFFITLLGFFVVVVVTTS